MNSKKRQTKKTSPMNSIWIQGRYQLTLKKLVSNINVEEQFLHADMKKNIGRILPGPGDESLRG